MSLLTGYIGCDDCSIEITIFHPFVIIDYFTDSLHWYCVTFQPDYSCACDFFTLNGGDWGQWGGAISPDTLYNFTGDQLDYQNKIGGCNNWQAGDPTLPGWTLQIYFFGSFLGIEQLILDTGRIYFSFDIGTQGELYCDLGGTVLDHYIDSVTVDCEWIGPPTKYWISEQFSYDIWLIFGYKILV